MSQFFLSNTGISGAALWKEVGPYPAVQISQLKRTNKHNLLTFSASNDSPFHWFSYSCRWRSNLPHWRFALAFGGGVLLAAIRRPRCLIVRHRLELARAEIMTYFVIAVSAANTKRLIFAAVHFFSYGRRYYNATGVLPDGAASVTRLV